MKKSISQEKLKVINDFLIIAKELEDYNLLRVILNYNPHLKFDDLNRNIKDEKDYLENLISIIS